MKSILVPVEQHASMRAVLDVSLLVAERFGSFVEGLALGPDIPEVIGIDVPAGWSLFDRKTQRELVEQSRQVFESFMREALASPRAESRQAFSHAWAGSELVGDSYLGRHGRIFDLVVLGRPHEHDERPRTACVEAALFESGRPVLLAPPAAPSTLGDTIVIAWNGSTETARSVALALPFLERARQIVVLSLDGWEVDGPSGEQLAQNLRRRGLAAEALMRGMDTASAGEAILRHCAGLRADLLIKGAYTQSRLSQMILGGATRHILSHARLPVLMAH